MIGYLLTLYPAALIGWILWDARHPTTELQDHDRMNVRYFFRALWARLSPVKHPTPADLAKADLQRKLYAQGLAKVERAISANQLTEDSARLVCREFARLTKTSGTHAAVGACVDYAATLAPRAKAVRW